MEHSIKQTQQQHDRQLIESTQRVMQEPHFASDGRLLSANLSEIPQTRTLFKPNRCYVCKTHYVEVHHFYHRLCPQCAKHNYQKRSATADLSGHIALVTGGRIKIGYQISLMLLRAGAQVIITTRFHHDAAIRYRQEADFNDWAERLTIHALDLRHIPSVESFTDYLHQHYGHLDIIVNNAAQTLRKPASYYVEMAKREQRTLQANEKQLLGHFSDKLLLQDQQQHLLQHELNIQDQQIRHNPLSPTVQNDEFGEPVDVSARNSWVETLDSVDTLELIETQVINAMAPFLLNSRLKPLMQRSPNAQRFIINVSAMEGQFNRRNKTHRHPHTNMAKAALNMMTRTAASDYSTDHIYMNSVDTGWVTQENPFPTKQRARGVGMVPPLDCVDGAARVVAPIFDALSGERATFGKFLKDYKETGW